MTTENISFQDIMLGFAEIQKMQKENAESFKETQAEIKALAASQKETEARFKETDVKFKETEARFKETEARFKETEARFKETDARFKETDAEIKAMAIARKEADARAEERSAKIDRQLEKLGQQIGGIGEKFGSFTEGLAYPSLRKILFEKYQIDNTVANYLRRLPNGGNVELDAFGFSNGTINNAAVVEVKSHLQSKHIYKFVDTLKAFRDNFPEFANKHLYGILCTVSVVSRELQQEIFANGLHLAYIHDDMFDLQMNGNAIDFNA